MFADGQNVRLHKQILIQREEERILSLLSEGLFSFLRAHFEWKGYFLAILCDSPETARCVWFDSYIKKKSWMEIESGSWDFFQVSIALITSLRLNLTA